MIINLIVPDKAKSLSENRSLQQFPAMDLAEVQSGDYQQSLNSWYSDQFVGRNLFVHSKYLVSKLTGNRKIDNVFLGKGMLIEDANEPNEVQLKRNLDAMNSFCDKHPDLKYYFMLVPNAVSVEKDKLPKNADVLSQKEQMDSIYSQLRNDITQVDIRDALNKHKDEYLYYKTDHHWTSLGAYYAFQTASKVLDLEDADKAEYDIYLGTKNFKGTLANKTGSISMKDEVNLYVPKDLPDYVCNNVSLGTQSRTMYSSAGLDSNDPYTVFLGGNAGIVRLEMDNKSNKRLLIFKDSYANTFLQFLIPYYRTITIVDPRYYFDDVNRIVESEVVTDVMYLYNTNTFIQDTSLADVIGS